MIQGKGGNSLLLVILHGSYLIDDIVNHLFRKTIAFQSAFYEDIAVTTPRSTVLGHLNHIGIRTHPQLFDHIALFAYDQPHTVIGNGQEKGLSNSYIVTRWTSVSGHGLVFEEIRC